VGFGTGAGSFQARVASGASGGRVEVRLGSPTGTLAGTCTTGGTGGWQSWTTVTCPVTGATGTQDLYLRFAGGTGSLLNVDWWQFTPTGGSTNLLVNGTAENGTDGWQVFGGGTLSPSTSVVRSGTRSLAITGRTAAWNGPGQDLTGRLTNGATYRTNIWVRAQTGTPSAKVTLALTTGTTTGYVQMTPATTMNTGGWTLLSGSATVSWTGTLSRATLYVETAAGTDGFHVDDASLE
jgi:arabinoxylan arabinofuranohydrolase